MDFSLNIPAQIVGIAAIIVWLLSIKQKDTKQVALYQAFANGLYGFQYLLLTAFSAAGMNGISFIRCYLTHEYLKRGVNPPKYLLILPAILMIIVGLMSIGLFSYKTFIITIIPVLITLLYVYSLWKNDLRFIYKTVLICAFVWFVYNFFVGAYIGMVGNIFEITFSLNAMKEYDEMIRKQKEEEERKRLEEEKRRKEKEKKKTSNKKKKKNNSNNKNNTNKKNNKKATKK